MSFTEETSFDCNSSDFEDESSYLEDNLVHGCCNKEPEYTRQELQTLALNYYKMKPKKLTCLMLTI